MRALTHPLVLGSLALWILNDHVLKGAFHNALTGKLSDVAGLIVFPLLAVAAHDLWFDRGRRSHNAWLVGSVVATGAVFASINVFEPAAEAYRVGLAALQYPFLALARGEVGPLHRVHLTMDPTDLATLPALAVPLLVGWVGTGRRAERRRPRGASRDAPRARPSP